MIRNNVEETVAVLEAAKRAKARVLITSSSEVYGKCPVLPLHESMDLVFGPTSASRWSYGLTKAIDEHLALDMARQHGLQAVVVRLFNTIGPRQVGHYGMVVPRFVEAAFRGQSIQVYGDGQQTRAFCDVRDVVTALTALLTQDAALGRVFNVGSEKAITINELANTVIDEAEDAGLASVSVTHVPYESVYGPNFEDTPHRLPDTAALRQVTGFAPTRTLRDTIRDLLALHRADASTESTGEACA